MTGRAAAWHASDVASFDVAVELSHALTAHLVKRGAASGDDFTAEILAIRRRIATTDPSDSAAVVAATRSITDRIAELES